VGGWLALTVPTVVVLRFIDPPTTAFILRDRFDAWRGNETRYVFQRAWVDSQRISAQLKLAVVASEDQKFPTHHGFDFEQINDAWEQREQGRKQRGASTISQQVAKNVFLWPTRSWLRKGLEAYFTVLIETFWSKQRILEVYLNVAEFGRGVYGAEAAARRYFHKSAAQLSAREAALLAAVLPNPRRLRAEKPSPYVRHRVATIVAQMQVLGPTTVAAL